MTRTRRRLAIAAFAILLPIAALRLWDYIEVRRFIAEIEAIQAKGEPITEQQAGRRRDPSSDATARTGRLYIAASLLVSQGALYKDLHPVREWIRGETTPRRRGEAPEVAPRPDQAVFSRLHGTVTAHQQALSLADEAALLPFDGFPGGTEFSYQLSHLAALANLLAARSLTRAAAGEGDAAVDAVIASLHYRRTLRELGAAWLNQRDYQTAAALSLAQPSIAALQRLRAALAAEDRPDDRLKLLLADRARILGFMWTRLYRTQVTNREGYRLPNGLMEVVMRPWMTHQAIDAVRTWSEVIEAARQPVIDAPNPSPEERVALVAARSNTFMAWKRAALESLTRVASAEGLTLDRASLAAVGVELFRRAHAGALPGTLDQLVPHYLDAIPADPATGRPLQYARDGNSYSIAGSNSIRVVIHH